MQLPATGKVQPGDLKAEAKAECFQADQNFQSVRQSARFSLLAVKSHMPQSLKEQQTRQYGGP